jgi:hypothetical protein
MMEQSLDTQAQRLIEQLQVKLARGEDVEAAIDVYKTVNWIIDRLQDVKTDALDLAEQDMRQRDLRSLKTRAGSAGWTEPKAKQLDEGAWEKALKHDPYLRQVQERYARAQAALEEAREPFMQLPEPRFFIR